MPTSLRRGWGSAEELDAVPDLRRVAARVRGDRRDLELERVAALELVPHLLREAGGHDVVARAGEFQLRRRELPELDPDRARLAAPDPHREALLQHRAELGAAHREQRERGLAPVGADGEAAGADAD